MSARHLAQGSQLPPFNGKLRIYSMRFCPYAQRIHLVLNAKKIPYEVVNVNLTEKPEWLTSKSPLGKVPALEVEEDICIYESLITAEYVDDKYQLPRLTSQDPLRKAQDKILVENFNGVTTSFFKGLMQKDAVDEPTLSTFFSGLEVIQSELIKRATKFLAGKNPGMVDYMIWPWFERFDVLTKFSERFALDKSQFTVLYNWMEEMKRDFAVKAHYLDTDKHYTFIEAKLTGKENYDFLL